MEPGAHGSETKPGTGQELSASIPDQMVIDMLRIELAEWRPWANDLLDYYLSGTERSCSEAISEKYGVSTRTVRKYKQQLEDFIKKYLWGVPF